LFTTKKTRIRLGLRDGGGEVRLLVIRQCAIDLKLHHLLVILAHRAPILRPPGFRVRGSGCGIRVSSFGFRVWESEFRVWESGFRVWGTGFRVSGLGSGFRGPSLRFRGPGFGFGGPGFGMGGPGFGLEDASVVQVTESRIQVLGCSACQGQIGWRAFRVSGCGFRFSGVGVRVFVSYLAFQVSGFRRTGISPR